MEVSLNEIGEIITGNTPSKSDTNFWNSPDICFIKPDVIAEDEITELLDSNEYISENARKKARIVNENSILVTCIGSIAKIGIVKIRECAFNQQINAIIPNKNIDTKYLCYCLQNSKVKLKAIANAPVVPIINKKQFGEFVVKIDGDISTQKKIVNRLDYVQSVITLYKIQLQKFDDLIKARFIEMFGDPIVNEKGWRTKPLLDMGQCKNGMNFHYDDKGIDINCLGVCDFKNFSVIDNTKVLPTVSLNEMPSEEYLLKDDDIVFVRSNGNKALVGRSLVVYPGNVPTTFSGFCIRYRKYDNEIIVPYLLRVLKTDSVRMKMAGRGANIQNLNQQILGTLVIPVPPIELQQQFADFVRQVDKSREAVKKSLEKTQQLYDSLMQEYFG
ncbi:restriction endonuclease subunit S [Holdemanella biformis]|uniref:restriction endonuclease subunit S n=1 Tax=Holdemanella biformis TaxID=1735 RepID=UPI0022E080FE|nr:restriction endonuclease subunit S [Holdemanella biformis]